MGRSPLRPTIAQPHTHVTRVTSHGSRSRPRATVNRAIIPQTHPMEKSLPSSCYTGPDFFRREQTEIFSHEWFCAGREEDLPAPGSHLVLDIAGESILVVRTTTGELKAHYNVCRH